MSKRRQYYRLFLWFYLTTACLPTIDLLAGTLFENRRIHLSNHDMRIFSIGITGTTAGYNYIALVEKAKQEFISLGDLGYWEMVSDPPSYLRNNDLQLVIENRSSGRFRIELKHDEKSQTINYRVIEGNIRITINDKAYYTIMIIEGAASMGNNPDAEVGRAAGKRYLFFDFNSFDTDLRRYYGRVMRLLKNKDYTSYFYCYEAGNYDSYYFKAYRHLAKLNTDKMGLSPEDGSLAYYQKVLDNIKSRFGTSLAGQILLVSRFGNRHANELKAYAIEIGMSKETAVAFLSYDDLDQISKK